MISSSFSGSVNQLGGVFTNGKPLPDHIRQDIIRMSLQGIKSCEISRQLKISHGCISKILNRFHSTGSAKPACTGGSRPKVATNDVISAIVDLKRNNPDMFAREIQEAVIDRGICTKETAPSLSSVNRILRRHSLGNRACSPDNLSRTNASLPLETRHSLQQFSNVPQLTGINSNSNGIPPTPVPSGLKRKHEDDGISLPPKVMKTEVPESSALSSTFDSNVIQHTKAPVTRMHTSNDKVKMQQPPTFVNPLSARNGNTTTLTNGHPVGQTGQTPKTQRANITLSHSYGQSSNGMESNTTTVKDFSERVRELQSTGFPYYHPEMGWMNLIPISYETMAELGLPKSIMSKSANSIFYDGDMKQATTKIKTTGQDVLTINSNAINTQNVQNMEINTKPVQTGAAAGKICTTPSLEFPKEQTFMTLNPFMNKTPNTDNPSSVITSTIRETKDQKSTGHAAPVQQEPNDKAAMTSGYHTGMVDYSKECQGAAGAVDLSDIMEIPLDDTGSTFDDFDESSDKLETPITPPFEQKFEAQRVKKELFPVLNVSY